MQDVEETFETHLARSRELKRLEKEAQQKVRDAAFQAKMVERQASQARRRKPSRQAGDARRGKVSLTVWLPDAVATGLRIQAVQKKKKIQDLMTEILIKHLTRKTWVD